MTDSIIKAVHVSHRYSVQWAVKDISFEIPLKGIYGLLGSNGAGKSTLMNIMCGVLRQTDGDVYINGVNTRIDPIGAKRHIGFLPQKPPLYGDLTVDEYLTHAADLRCVAPGGVRRAVDEVLELCAITHFHKRLIKNLSGGYQQRVGIAQAIVHKPSLVVFDEPTNGLDPNQILEIRNLIREIAEERTVVLSTHILTEVQAVCDHILMLEQGSMVFSGSTTEFDNYMQPDTVYLCLADAPAKEELERIEGVSGVEELGGGQFRIHFVDGGNVIDRIVDSSVERRWLLQEIRREKSSLDAIFAELSKNTRS